LHAGGHHLSGLQGSPLHQSTFFCSPDALDAKSAFFHDAGAADGYIWIELFIEGLIKNRIEEIEEPDFVGIIVLAIAGAHAAIVDLKIQVFALAV
jgi:hypothetical protein